MSDATRYQQNLDVAYRSIEGEAVLVLPQTSEVRVLNAVGSCIWEAMEQPRTLAELTQTVVDAFEVNSQTARADAETFLEELIDKGLAQRLAQQE